jgi:hypothetical protein
MYPALRTSQAHVEVLGMWQSPREKVLHHATDVPGRRTGRERRRWDLELEDWIFLPEIFNLF